MHRTTINLDEELYRIAAEELGTEGHRSETINEALRQVVEARRRREAVEMFQQLDFDLSEENLRGAWR